MCFKPSKFHGMKKMARYKIINLKDHLKFLSKPFAEHTKEKLVSNDSSFLSILKNAKTNTTLTI